MKNYQSDAIYYKNSSITICIFLTKKLLSKKTSKVTNSNQKFCSIS